MKYLEYSGSIKSLMDRIDEKGLEYALEVADFYNVELEYIEVDSGLYRIVDTRIGSGYFSPSLLTKYFHCARKMWLSNIYGDLVDDNGLKRLLRGKIAHRLWTTEHRDFIEEFEVFDDEWMVHGFIDALKLDGERTIIVELKTSHRINLGHELQAMLYKITLDKMINADSEAYIVYRHGVRRIKLNSDLLKRYMKRVLTVLRSEQPPPPLPDRKHCSNCPYRIYCSKYPSMSWDEWLVNIGDLPKGEKCRECPMLHGCRRYRAKTGRYPCEARQMLLI